MSEIILRRMRREDLDQAVLLDCMSFSLPWPPSAYLNELTNSGGRTWVAEQVLEAPLAYRSPLPIPVADLVQPAGAHAVVGLIVVWLIVDEAHIATLAVHPEMRRQGIAKQLVCIALQEAAKVGAFNALLEVRAGNEAAQALYRKFGFEVVGRRPRYYQDNHEDALLMTLAPLKAERLNEICG
ncbi:MAG: ribosomal protein S18-alanine N-acetyltransferase [Betaproteobacteria bacterium]